MGGAPGACAKSGAQAADHCRRGEQRQAGQRPPLANGAHKNHCDHIFPRPSYSDPDEQEISHP